LSTTAEPTVCSALPGEQPIAEADPDGRPSGHDVADCQRRQIDAKQLQVSDSWGVKRDLGQPGIGEQRQNLRNRGDHEPDRRYAAELVQIVARAGNLR
jgi:hypothetical protein